MLPLLPLLPVLALVAVVRFSECYVVVCCASSNAAARCFAVQIYSHFVDLKWL
jgi:hypothetical protein